MLLYQTTQGPLVEDHGRFFAAPDADWDRLFNRDHLGEGLAAAVGDTDPVDMSQPLAQMLRPPIGRQEVWAAGVTYHRSRTARMEESEEAGGSDFYDRVYHADRPELFLKATPHRVVGHSQAMHLRRDSKWIVPEPELTLAVTATGKIFGYTVGNDLSARDIEGENPLYLPQAKTFNRCCAIGPGVLVRDEPLPDDTPIVIEISRDGERVFGGETSLAQMKQTLENLVGYLMRENSFPHGFYLMTGTGIVPPDDFTLQQGDVVRITIEPIGTLVNTME